MIFFCNEALQAAESQFDSLPDNTQPAGVKIVTQVASETGLKIKLVSPVCQRTCLLYFKFPRMHVGPIHRNKSSCPIRHVECEMKRNQLTDSLKSIFHREVTSFHKQAPLLRLLSGGFYKNC